MRLLKRSHRQREAQNFKPAGLLGLGALLSAGGAVGRARCPQFPRWLHLMQMRLARPLAVGSKALPLGADSWWGAATFGVSRCIQVLRPLRLEKPEGFGAILAKGRLESLPSLFNACRSSLVLMVRSVKGIPRDTSKRRPLSQGGGSGP